MGTRLSIEEYAKRYRKVAEENNLEVTDEEIAKMFTSHIVVEEWKAEEVKEQNRREKQLVSERYKNRR